MRLWRIWLIAVAILALAGCTAADGGAGNEREPPEALPAPALVVFYTDN